MEGHTDRRGVAPRVRQEMAISCRQRELYCLDERSTSYSSYQLKEYVKFYLGVAF